MKVREIVRDFIFLISFSAVVYGIYQIFEPAAWIFGGGSVLWLAFPVGKGDKK